MRITYNIQPSITSRTWTDFEFQLYSLSNILHNGFKDCILVADDFGIPICHITKAERSSKFKICNRFRKTGQDILIKVNLNVWKN